MSDSAVSASIDLISATDLEQAQLAASDVVDLALDGGCALSESSAGIADLVVAGHSRAAFPAYLLAVLISIGRWIGAWSRVAETGTTSVEIDRGDGQERLAARIIGDFVVGSMGGPLPADPEERSLFYRLCGVVCPNPAAAAEWLIDAAESETDTRARAVLAEAVAVSLARGGFASSTPAADWLRGVVRSDATGDVLLRLAVAPHDYVGRGTDANRQQISELIDMDLPEDGYPAMWPSELL